MDLGGGSCTCMQVGVGPYVNPISTILIILLCPASQLHWFRKKKTKCAACRAPWQDGDHRRFIKFRLWESRFCLFLQASATRLKRYHLPLPLGQSGGERKNLWLLYYVSKNALLPSWRLCSSSTGRGLVGTYMQETVASSISYLLTYCQSLLPSSLAVLILSWALLRHRRAAACCCFCCCTY